MFDYSGTYLPDQTRLHFPEVTEMPRARPKRNVITIGRTLRFLDRVGEDCGDKVGTSGVGKDPKQQTRSPVNWTTWSLNRIK